MKSEDSPFMNQESSGDKKKSKNAKYVPKEDSSKVVAEDISMYNIEQLEKRKKDLRKQLERAVSELDFEKAAQLRDEILRVDERIRQY